MAFSKPLNAEVIVFSRYTDPHWQIWSKDLESGKENQLTNTPVDKKAPKCFENSKEIIFQTANSELVRFESGKEEKLLDKYGIIMDHNWSLDGDWVAFTRLNSDIWDDSEVWIKNKGDASVRLTNQPGLQYSPALSNDLQKIIFVSQDKTMNSHNLWVMDRNGNNLEQLTKGAFYDLNPDISPDGKNMTFSSNRAEGFDIWKLDMESKQLNRLTTYKGLESSPVFSGNGNKIFFVSTESGQKQIWMMELMGENKTQVTMGTEPSHDPNWCF